MSITSKITLATSFAVSFGIIGYVHYRQNDDKDRLHQGVLRDIERQQQRKVENIYNLQQQIDLTSRLRTDQKELENQQVHQIISK